MKLIKFIFVMALAIPLIIVFLTISFIGWLTGLAVWAFMFGFRKGVKR